MVKVTEQAKQALDDLRSEAVARLPEEAKTGREPSLRLIVQGTQAGLALDYPQENDQIVEHDGHPVLLVDSELSQILDGATVDVTSTPEGERLTLKREGE